ncbi:MAG: DUF362 domain-containing protein [Phycisphaerae bacterium]
MPASVYFVPASFDEPLDALTRKARALFAAADMARVVRPKDLIAVKLHFGEPGNTTHLQPKHVRGFVDCISQLGGRAFLTDTATLYAGRRSNAVDHVITAIEHGFTIDQAGAPVIMADGLFGNAELSVPAPGTDQETVALAAELVRAQGVIVITHVTGHGGAGLGGTIKNVGMGCASRKGKMLQHSNIKPSIDPQTCQFCRVCMLWCPANAISQHPSLDAAVIDSQLCIGCGECLAVCRVGAVRFNWGVGSADMQRKMATHTLALHRQKQGRIAYVSYLVNITQECDCFGRKLDVAVPDIGILASLDPVAIDQASLDLFEKHVGQSFRRRFHRQIDPTIALSYGQQIGLGCRRYQLIELTSRQVDEYAAGSLARTS